MDDDILKKLIHDLSGSMSVISGFLKTLDVQRLSEEDREHLSAAARSSEKMISMIRSIEKDIYLK